MCMYACYGSDRYAILCMSTHIIGHTRFTYMHLCDNVTYAEM